MNNLLSETLKISEVALLNKLSSIARTDFFYCNDDVELCTANKWGTYIGKARGCIPLVYKELRRGGAEPLQGQGLYRLTIRG